MADDQTALIGRQDRLEGRMTALEGTVREEATLRAKTDLELSKITHALRAQKLSLQALHDTQSDHTRRLTIMEDDLRTVKDDVKVLKRDVSGLKDDVKILKQDVSGLKDDVKVLKRDVSGLKDDVKILKQDVSGLKDDVKILKQDVSGLKQDSGKVLAGIQVIIEQLNRLN
jgi:chromosome segregation ATPase